MKSSHKNPSSIKSMLASRFLRAMKRLKNNTHSSPSMSDNKYKRYHAIRAAAYASMASVVGPNKLWSRAVLSNIKNRRMKERNNTHRCRHRSHARNPRCDLGLRPINDLRELVPGSKALSFGKLLNETSDYIECLRAQVEVMRKIVDYSSKMSL